MSKTLMGASLDVEEKEMAMNGLEKLVLNCEKCSLFDINKKKLHGKGSLNAKIMFIADSPRNDDYSNSPFSKENYDLMNEIFSEIGISEEDYYLTNIIRCHNSYNSSTDIIPITRCNYFLKKQIEIISPNIIVALGLYSSRSLLFRDDGIGDMRLENIHIESPFWFDNKMDVVLPIISTFHPHHISYDHEKRDLLLNDLKKSLNYINKNRINKKKENVRF